jgi:hypothetical protein
MKEHKSILNHTFFLFYRIYKNYYYDPGYTLNEIDGFIGMAPNPNPNNNT